MSSTTEARVAVITGGSSGIGLHAARALRGRGLNVYELSRRAENAEPGVTHLQADVTDEAQVNAAVAEILRREGRIDILINNAGFGISGAIEFTPAQEARRQFDVNFFGMVNMNHAVLPIMRQQGGGRIVNMSSVAAPIAIPFQAYYSASKAAVRTYSLALASEVRPFGIEVCVIMPGDIATGFTAARRKSCDGDDVYHGRIARSVAVMEHDEQTGMSAEYAGQWPGAPRKSARSSSARWDTSTPCSCFSCASCRPGLRPGSSARSTHPDPTAFFPAAQNPIATIQATSFHPSPPCAPRFPPSRSSGSASGPISARGSIFMLCIKILPDPIRGGPCPLGLPCGSGTMRLSASVAPRWSVLLSIFSENKYCPIPSEAGLVLSGSPAALVP